MRNMNAESVARVLGKLGASLFSGSYIYVALVHQPTILDHDDKGAVEAFIAMFKRSHATQLTYVFVSAASSLYGIITLFYLYVFASANLYCIYKS